MEQIWYTIENGAGKLWDADADVFGHDDEATVYDEYNDAALVAQGLGHCAVIKNMRQVGVKGSLQRSVAGEF